MPQIRRWHVYPDGEQMYRHAAAALTRAAAQAIAARGEFRIVLSGGATPQPLYRLLTSAQTRWAQWHIYFGDERCRPIGDRERNDALARSAWLEHVPVPAAQIHGIPAELGAEPGARRYADVLAGVERFDLVLLGLGADGHAASLFAHHPEHAAADAPAAVAVHDAPKPPPERVSLSARRLSRTRQAWFLVGDAGKRAAVADWARGGALPAAWIAPADGVDVLIERAALPIDAPLAF